MALESPVSTIYDLVATNPVGSDPKAQGDDHIRNIKTALAASFAKSTATSGYQKVGGIIIQWGVASLFSGSPYASTTVTFPIAFPTQCVYAGATSSGAGVSCAIPGIGSLTGMTITNSTAATSSAWWIAVGY